VAIVLFRELAQLCPNDNKKVTGDTGE